MGVIKIFNSKRYLMKTFCSFYHTFLLLQKSIKKGARKKDTPLFPEGSLIKLLYYCKLRFSSLICNLYQRKQIVNPNFLLVLVRVA